MQDNTQDNTQDERVIVIETFKINNPDKFNDLSGLLFIVTEKQNIFNITR